MLYLKSFTFNPFQENTYLLYDENGVAFIIDPGNHNNTENTVLKNFIKEKNLTLTRLLLTHAHIDHILGNKFIYDTYGLLPELHKEELYFIERLPQTATTYGVPFEPSPMPKKFIEPGDKILLGAYEFETLFTPGHSPGSISYFNKENNLLISGDVLFHGSVGRTDLPKGDHSTLLKSIKEKLLVLDDKVKVYSGHGQSTTIGYEKQNNPFLKM